MLCDISKYLHKRKGTLLRDHQVQEFKNPFPFIRIHEPLGLYSSNITPQLQPQIGFVTDFE